MLLFTSVSNYITYYTVSQLAKQPKTTKLMTKKATLSVIKTKVMVVSKTKVK